MEKFTDEQIVKALECCMQDDTPLEVVCYHCPIKQERPNCVRKLASNSLDLINRQKAEIEELNVELVGMRGAANSYKMHYENAQAEIKRLKSLSTSNYKVWTVRDKALVLTDTLEDYEQFKRSIEIEAIKEFAEMLKKKISDSVYNYWNTNDCGYYLAEDVDGDIDNLVSEMTEQKNDFKE